MKVIKYGAEWCGPCRTTEENLKKAGVEFTSIDISENEDIAIKRGIRSIPVVEFYANDDSEEPDIILRGLQTVDSIKEALDKIK